MPNWVDILAGFLADFLDVSSISTSEDDLLSKATRHG